MRKTPWLLALANAIVAILLGLGNYVGRAGVDTLWPWVQPLARPLETHALRWVLVLTWIGVVIPLLERYLGGYEFQKARVQGVLGTMVDELFDGDAKEHRCTLFRAVRGWRALISGICRLPWQDDRWAKLKEVMVIRPWGLYLYAYVRPKRSMNPRSSVAYRIYRHKDRDCEGAAGMVWQKDVHTIRNAPVFEPGALRNINELDTYDVSDPIRIYAAATNIKSARQLRARNHYGRHFHGTVIEDSSGVKWGVLLLDSTSSTCPIPQSKKGDKIDQTFRRYAEILANVLT